jgi:MGT family glycosyltransferase
VAKFLISVWPFQSHFFPLVAIAHALRSRGHEVAFYTGTAARPVVESEGFCCFPFKHVNDQNLDALMFTRTTYASLNQPLQFKALLRAWLLGTLPQQVEDLTTIMAAWQPDVIVSETSMWGPILVLHETHAIPVAVFSTVIGCLLPGPEAPLGGGMPRPRHRPRRLLARLLRAVGDLLAADFRRIANEHRQRYGLPPLAVSVTEFTGQMPLYLVPTTPEFDYERRDLPPAVHYIGPCLWNKPQHDPPPEWLGQLSHEQPWVHVTEGTMHTQEPLVLRAAAQGLAHLPMQVIMTTGGHRKPEEMGLGPLAPNVLVERWVAHSDLLPHTDVVVTTGGAGTIMTVLQAGVPLVVVPTEWDKPQNARRVVDTGVGVRLAPRHCTPKRLREVVEHVLKEPAYRQNAQRMQAAFARYDGPTRAADLLENLPIQQKNRTRKAI